MLQKGKKVLIFFCGHARYTWDDDGLTHFVMYRMDGPTLFQAKRGG